MAQRRGRVEGKVALVTGGRQGIGFETARLLAAEGARVVIGDVADTSDAVERIRADGGEALGTRLDVTSAEQAEAAVALAVGRFGGLHVLVNNAGVGGPMQLPSETPAEQVRTVYETNVFGVITVTNALLPLLRKAPSARIVNVSSAIGSLKSAAENNDQTGEHPPGEFPVTLLSYASSKTALNAVTLAYANELRGTGILVNAASPGFVATDINGHHGRLTTEQGARIPVLLATLPDDGPTATFLGEDGTPEGQVLDW